MAFGFQFRNGRIVSIGMLADPELLEQLEVEYLDRRYRQHPPIRRRRGGTPSPAP
jgi:hypothetical protein